MEYDSRRKVFVEVIKIWHVVSTSAQNQFSTAGGTVPANPESLKCLDGPCFRADAPPDGLIWHYLGSPVGTCARRVVVNEGPQVPHMIRNVLLKQRLHHDTDAT